MNAVVISKIRVSCSLRSIVIIHRCCISEIVFAVGGGAYVNIVRTIIDVDYTQNRCFTSMTHLDKQCATYVKS